jgi:tRNA pseudouridine38-40 synthase
MNRYAIKISYDGSKFHGWQIQKESPTVQECLENALKCISKTNIKVIGAGRTDAGVHALEQIAHFDFDIDIPLPKMKLAIQSKLNHYIKILDLQKVSENFHARFDAILREYFYIITLNPTPFNHHYKAYFHKYKIDPKIFNDCFKYFIGEHDFTSFSKPNPEIKNHICKIHELYMTFDNDDFIIHISANRFLHNMIRRIIGAIVSVSHYNLSPCIISQWLNEKKHNQKNYKTANSNGLYLKKIVYNNFS